MRLIIYRWNAVTEPGVIEQIKNLGHDVCIIDTPCKDYMADMQLAWELLQKIHSLHADGVFSVNFLPVIAMTCDSAKIPYFSWVYDCPHLTLFTQAARLPGNRIFVFDRGMAENLCEKGVTGVTYLPLAVMPEAFQIDTSKGLSVSFVGSLYTDAHNYYEQIRDESLRLQVDEVIEQAIFCYGTDYEHILSDTKKSGLCEKLVRYFKSNTNISFELGSEFLISPEEIALSEVIEKKITVEERKRLLLAIGDTVMLRQSRPDDLAINEWTISVHAKSEKPDATAHKNECFSVYTNSALPSGYERLQSFVRGPVDYETQMPAIFAHSKINLNISLRSIHTGIPLRVMDILACGGFALSNEQPELSEYFQTGKEVETFSSEEECIEKIRFYLSHEEERSKIALRGHERAATIFSCENALKTIFSVKI